MLWSQNYMDYLSFPGGGKITLHHNVFLELIKIHYS